eukprot:CAMPEP_0194104854 /NCGR_PEP_ID=MMETSP0150-20130528/5116_1 /TAXON_ID=122233 /ORGANISM="Chaetoceros debilis, Strain MM31A-1" /LENGTH=263 /DNA_ID=CAMNT_0038792507 /DNA_START=77 /DNA_END=868 /DNA_ORIENTATION=+
MNIFSFILAAVNATTLGSAFMTANTVMSSRSSIQSTSEKTIEPSTINNDVTIAEMKCEAGGSILDEAAMLAEQNFPISPNELISKAKQALVKDCGVLDPSLWADDFEFCAPYVGPLSKERFLEAANGFQIYDSFSDFDNRYFGFNVDPIEPGRVWFMTRLRATNDGLGLFGKKEPTNKTVVLPPQMYSFLFNEDGSIRELTVGYPVDRRQGNTGGLGGMFGVFYGVGQGLPFPEGKPYQLSRRFRLFTKIGDLVSQMKDKKKE